LTQPQTPPNVTPWTPETTLKSRRDALDPEEAAAHEATRPVTLDQQSTGRLTRMDALQNQAMAQAQVRRRAAERLRTQAALARLAEGEYGFCNNSGEPGEHARHAEDPPMPKCRDCMQAG